MIRRHVAALVAGALLTACSHAIGPVPSGPTAAGPQMVVPVLGQVTAHSLPAVKFFKIPTSFSWPEYIANGPDGNLWFTEYYAKQIARITPAGAVTEFSLPFGDDVEAIVAGPDGNLWFTQPGANKIGRITTSGVLA